MIRTEDIDKLLSNLKTELIELSNNGHIVEVRTTGEIYKLLTLTIYPEKNNEIAEKILNIHDNFAINNDLIHKEKNRGFEIVDEKHRIFPNVDVQLPLRGSKKSAGYDFYSNEEVIIEPHEKHIFWTDMKSYMKDGEVLEIVVRSSIGIKKGLALSNTLGIIDKDYYQNQKNDGNIGICLHNMNIFPEKIEFGERIAQGIFKSFLESDNCNSEEERIGGIGSTNKK